MFNRIITVVGAWLALVSTTGPALAGPIVVSPIPEPGTMGIFAVGIAGAYVARKFLGRKKK